MVSTPTHAGRYATGRAARQSDVRPANTAASATTSALATVRSLGRPGTRGETPRPLGPGASPQRGDGSHRRASPGAARRGRAAPPRAPHAPARARAAYRGRRAYAVATFDGRGPCSRPGDGHQPLNALCGHARGGGVVSSRGVWQEALAVRAGIQRVQRGDGPRDAWPQALLLARSQSPRAHDPTPLLPRVGLPGAIQAA